MDKKKHILQLIEQNPYISQQEIAEELGLSRSAAAGYISSLMREGEILGKAYVLKDKQAVCCIGGANIDRKLRAANFSLGDSNPVTGTETIGGVARNIAANLSQLGVASSLFTLVGDGLEAERILHQQDMDVSLTKKLPSQRTGTYTAVLNHSSELIVALAEMDIYDAFIPEILESQWSRLTAFDMFAADTNLPKETMQWLMDNKKQHQQLAVIPVSAAKIDRIPFQLSGIDLLVLNEKEAELLAARYDENFLEKEAMIRVLQNQGVPNIVITYGNSGVLAAFGTKMKFLEAPEAEVIDVTGAGDAFASVLVKAVLQQASLFEACEQALLRAKATIESEETVLKSREGK